MRNTTSAKSREEFVNSQENSTLIQLFQSLSYHFKKKLKLKKLEMFKG